MPEFLLLYLKTNFNSDERKYFAVPAIVYNANKGENGHQNLSPIPKVQWTENIAISDSWHTCLMISLNIHNHQRGMELSSIESK